MTGEQPLTVLVVDDEPPALDDLRCLLLESRDVGEVVPAADPITALRLLQSGQFDAAYLDISMPGLDGLELAGLLSRLATPPAIIFVTAHEEHALAAYGIGAVDYLLKPVRSERLAESITRVRRVQGAPVDIPEDDLAALSVETGGRTRIVRREQVRFVEAHGDYVRLHTATGAYLVRMPLSLLERRWGPAGFARAHRSYLVSLTAVIELRNDRLGELVAHTASGDVPVSRRHGAALRQRLLTAARSGSLLTEPAAPPPARADRRR